MIVELISFFAFIILVTIVLRLEQRNSISMDERLRAPETNIGIEQETIFDKFDAKVNSQNKKKEQRKYARPETIDIFQRGGLYSLIGIMLLYANGKLNLGHIDTILLSFVFAFIFSYAMQKFYVVPKYIKSYEDALPGNIKLLAQEIDFQANVAEAMRNTKNYAHPEVSRVFNDIARLNSLGLSIEQAIMKVLPDVTSDKFIMLLAAMLIHEQTGGCLASVLRNLADLFYSQILVAAKVNKKTAATKIFAFVGAMAFPLFGLFLYYYKNELFHSFMNDPVGLIIVKSVVVLMSINLFLSIYFLRGMRL